MYLYLVPCYLTCLIRCFERLNKHQRFTAWWIDYSKELWLVPTVFFFAFQLSFTFFHYYHCLPPYFAEFSKFIQNMLVIKPYYYNYSFLYFFPLKHVNLLIVPLFVILFFCIYQLEYISIHEFIIYSTNC